MIRRALTLALLLGLPLTGPSAEEAEQSYLTLHFTGLDDRKGDLRIAVSGSPQKHSDENRPDIGMTVDLQRSTGPVRLGPLPYGVYSVKAFQDINRNTRLDKNLLGRPAEPYGFSNNARGRFGPPSWESALFSLQTPEHSLTIELK